ncbi:MAG: phosphotransferase family protein [Candidatus Binatia bacterium]
MQTTLATFIAQELGKGVEIIEFQRLVGGSSCDVYRFEARIDGEAAARELVLRIDRPGKAIEGDRREEFELIAAAARAGVTVPEVYWSGGPEAGMGGTFFIMERIRGESLGRRLLRDERFEQTRRRLPARLARELARLHAIDLDDPKLSFLLARAPSGDDRRFALAAVDYWKGFLDAVAASQPRPLLELTARWLSQQAPPLRQPALVHGDFRVGNFMFDEEGLKAVLDWELAHLGDPMEDLGWLMVRSWRFGKDELAVGGLCSREQFYSMYADESGVEVDPETVRYWEVFGNWKWAIICIGQAMSHKAGAYPNVELAAIGRRVPEVELEILELLERP